MEWLFTHADDEDVDSPLTEEERRRVVERARNFSVDSEVGRVVWGLDVLPPSAPLKSALSLNRLYVN